MVWPFTLQDYFTGLFSKQFQNLIHQMRNENTHEYEQEFFIMYLDIKTKLSQLISKGWYSSKKKDVGNEMVKLQLNQFSKCPFTAGQINWLVTKFNRGVQLETTEKEIQLSYSVQVSSWTLQISNPALYDTLPCHQGRKKDLLRLNKVVAYDQFTVRVVSSWAMWEQYLVTF